MACMRREMCHLELQRAAHDAHVPDRRRAAVCQRHLRRGLWLCQMGLPVWLHPLQVLYLPSSRSHLVPLQYTVHISLNVTAQTLDLASVSIQRVFEYCVIHSHRPSLQTCPYSVMFPISGPRGTASGAESNISAMLVLCLRQAGPAAEGGGAGAERGCTGGTGPGVL